MCCYNHAFCKYGKIKAKYIRHDTFTYILCKNKLIADDWDRISEYEVCIIFSLLDKIIVGETIYITHSISNKILRYLPSLLLEELVEGNDVTGELIDAKIELLSRLLDVSDTSELSTLKIDGEVVTVNSNHYDDNIVVKYRDHSLQLVYDFQLHLLLINSDILFRIIRISDISVPDDYKKFHKFLEQFRRVNIKGAHKSS